MLSESDRTGEGAGVGVGDCARASAGSNNNAMRVAVKIIRVRFMAISLRRSRLVSHLGEGEGRPPLWMASKIESFTMFRLLHASSVAFTRLAMRTRSSIVKL